MRAAEASVYNNITAPAKTYSVRYGSPCLTVHPVGRNALHKWRKLPETGSLAAETSKYSTQLQTSLPIRSSATTAPYVRSVQEANGANIRGSGNFGCASYGRPCKQHGTATNESKRVLPTLPRRVQGKLPTAYTRIGTLTSKHNIL